MKQVSTTYFVMKWNRENPPFRLMKMNDQTTTVIGMKKAPQLDYYQTLGTTVLSDTAMMPLLRIC